MKSWVNEEGNNRPDSGGRRIRWEYEGKLKKSYRHPGNKGGCAIAGANNNYFFLVINLYNNNNNRAGPMGGLATLAFPPAQPRHSAASLRGGL